MRPSRNYNSIQRQRCPWRTRPVRTYGRPLRLNYPAIRHHWRHLKPAYLLVMNDHIPAYISINDAASILSVSADFIRGLIKDGKVQAVKLPGARNAPVRILRESMTAMLESSKIKAIEPSPVVIHRRASASSCVNRSLEQEAAAFWNPHRKIGPAVVPARPLPLSPCRADTSAVAG